MLEIDRDTLNGWLLDVYEHPEDGVVVCLLEEDGFRYLLRQPFPITFYASGPFRELRKLWKVLAGDEVPLQLTRTQRQDLFIGMVEVLGATVPKPAQFKQVFYRTRRLFPDLTWYDADIPTAMRYTAAFTVFPMAKVQVELGEDCWIRTVTVCDTPWELEPALPPIRVLKLGPNIDPFHAPPETIWVKTSRKFMHLPLYPIHNLLIQLASILKRVDPDLILSQYGDTWLFPLLTEYCQENKIKFFNLNRDPEREVLQREAQSIFTYGQTLYRGRQTHLFGRWHIDECNAMMYGDYGLEGVIEQARVTGIPVQEAARKSPGAGITALQIIHALKDNILVPYQKQQAESFKSARQLISGDRGGMVSQPIVGLHQNVAEIDFVSMYPSIMVNFNVSPETVGVDSENADIVPELGIPIDNSRTGFIPKTLRPCLRRSSI